MTELRRLLHKVLILPHLLVHLKPGQSCHLVGGALRDFLLGRPSTDFDFVTSFDPTDLARAFATTIGGHWFPLDTQRHQSRVIFKKEGVTYTYDFAPLRASSLNEDLSLRDFTINAIALDLAGFDRSPHIIDPLRGQLDLERSILRACCHRVFEDDPLRVLRGVRLARVLNLDIEPDTLTLMKDSVSALSRVAPERIGSELAQIFTADDGTRSLPLMKHIGLFQALFGEPDCPQAIAAGIQQVQMVSRHLDRLKHNGVVPAESWFDGFPTIAILRLAAFLSGSGLLARHSDLPRKLKFSRRVESLLMNLVALKPEDGNKLLLMETTERGFALWVDQLGPDPLLSLLYLASIREPSEEFPRKVRAVMAAYQIHARNGRVPDLVDGSSLGLAQGVLVGEALASLRIEEIEGRVRNVHDAHNYLKLYVEKIIDKPADHS